MAKLRIDRKAYTRKPHKRTLKSGKTIPVEKTKVPRTKFLTKDVGAKGRTPKAKRVIPKLKKGTLGVSFKDPAKERRKQLKKLAKKVGEKSVQGKLQAVSTLTKKTNPEVSKKAKADRKWVAKHFEGKKYMR